MGCLLPVHRCFRCLGSKSAWLGDWWLKSHYTTLFECLMQLSQCVNCCWCLFVVCASCLLLEPLCQVPVGFLEQKGIVIHRFHLCSAICSYQALSYQASSYQTISLPCIQLPGSPDTRHIETRHSTTRHPAHASVLVACLKVTAVLAYFSGHACLASGPAGLIVTRVG